MIKNWLVKGDCHGKFDWLDNLDERYNPQETAIIILGDVGLNFYLNKTDIKNKRQIQNRGYTIYCVRGNHEERPENLDTMKTMYDVEVNGMVYIEEQFLNIRYFIDGHEYSINGHSALVIGGAYSVDKYYRLSKFTDKDKWTGWFKDEQLTTKEMNDITSKFTGKHFDFILTHTCPYSWQPFDLFLSNVDQNTVDKTMELWLDYFKKNVTWKVWLFGHFHDDRLVRPGVEMFFNCIEDIEDIYERWTSGKELDWWLRKDPNYYFKEDNT